MAYFPPIKLYRNDLEEILATLNKVCKAVDLSDDQHEFESLDDIKTNLGHKVKRLTISGKSPYISIEIGSSLMGDVRLSVSEDSDAAKILFHELKDFLQQKLKWVSRVSFKYAWIFVLGLASLIFFTSKLEPLFMRFWFLLPLVLCYVLLTNVYLSLYLLKLKGSSIYLDYKYNLDFWNANRDKIIVGLIMAFIGILGTLFVQYIIRKLVQ